MSNVQHFLQAHWHAILVVLGVYIAIGNALARKWPVPSANAPLWKRIAHFLLVNVPHAGAALQGRTVWGFRFDIPLVSFTVRPDDTTGAMPPPNSQRGRASLVVLMIIALVGFFSALAMAGCATSATEPGTTLADKLHADEVAFKQIEADVATQCGPKFAPLGVLAGSILAIAADASTGNVAGAVGAAAAAIPAIVADVEALMCVEKVVTADYKALKPVK